MIAAQTLYISYNGIGEPLVRSQVLNYQERMAGQGIGVRLLTFEKTPPDCEDAIRAELAGKGIAWQWRPYRGASGGLGTLRDVIDGARIIRMARREIDFVHCRSFIPALMAFLAGLLGHTPFIYDVRGFWAHEKRYKGRIRSETQFRLARFLEGRLYAAADAIVTLTQASLDLLRRDYPAHLQGKPAQVIPTCADVTPYLVERRPLDANAPVLVYSGTLTQGYMCDELFAFYAQLRSRLPHARLRILSRTDGRTIAESAQRVFIRPEEYTVQSLTHSRMAAALLDCDASINVMRPGFARIASCPTKMAEYLAAGLPVVSTAGIGDVDQQLTSTRTGHIIETFDEASMDIAIDALIALMRDPDMIGRARKAAKELFSLELGVERYAQLYRDLLAATSR